MTELTQRERLIRRLLELPVDKLPLVELYLQALECGNALPLSLAAEPPSPPSLLSAFHTSPNAGGTYAESPAATVVALSVRNPSLVLCPGYRQRRSFAPPARSSPDSKPPSAPKH